MLVAALVTTLEIHMPETIGGIPLHPLFVHAPVVLIPFAAIFAVLWAVVPKWRSRLQWVVLVLVSMSWLSTLLAASTGESLAESIRETGLIEEHEEAAEMLETFIWVFFISTLALFSLERWGERLGGARKALTIVAAVAVVIGAGGAVAMDVLAGHSGAKAAWDGYEQAKG